MTRPFPIMSDLTRLVPRPAPQDVNTGLSACKPRTLKRVFGLPRETFSQDCQPVTSAKLKNRIVTGKWFGARVTGLDVAVHSLARIEAKIREHHPELAPHMGNAGMLCCRYVRGSKSSISNHSWGTAIDLTFDGEVDKRGDGKCQAWLLLVYGFFHAEGWFWGTSFPTEDSMHFELADETVAKLSI